MHEKVLEGGREDARLQAETQSKGKHSQVVKSYKNRNSIGLAFRAGRKAQSASREAFYCCLPADFCISFDDSYDKHFSDQTPSLILSSIKPPEGFFSVGPSMSTFRAQKSPRPLSPRPAHARST